MDGEDVRDNRLVLGAEAGAPNDRVGRGANGESTRTAAPEPGQWSDGDGVTGWGAGAMGLKPWAGPVTDEGA